MMIYTTGETVRDTRDGKTYCFVFLGPDKVGFCFEPDCSRASPGDFVTIPMDYLEPVVSGDWYGIDEVKRWTEADQRGFGEHAEWLAAQLNAAFRKGQQIASGHLHEALNAISYDMHQSGSRPCATCNLISSLVGKPFGCVAFAERKARTQCASS